MPVIGRLFYNAAVFDRLTPFPTQPCALTNPGPV